MMSLALAKCDGLVLSTKVMARLKAEISPAKMPFTNSAPLGCTLRRVKTLAIAEALKLSGCGMPSFSCKALLGLALSFKGKSFG